MADKKGKGSDTAKKANAKASKEGKSNPRKSSAAQSELGKKGGKRRTRSPSRCPYGICTPSSDLHRMHAVQIGGRGADR